MSHTRTKHYAKHWPKRANTEIFELIKYLNFTPLSELNDFEKCLAITGMIKVETALPELDKLGLWYWDKYDADILVRKLKGDKLAISIYTGVDKA